LEPAQDGIPRPEHREVPVEVVRGRRHMEPTERLDHLDVVVDDEVGHERHAVLGEAFVMPRHGLSVTADDVRPEAVDVNDLPADPGTRPDEEAETPPRELREHVARVETKPAPVIDERVVHVESYEDRRGSSDGGHRAGVTHGSPPSASRAPVTKRSTTSATVVSESK